MITAKIVIDAESLSASTIEPPNRDEFLVRPRLGVFSGPSCTTSKVDEWVESLVDDPSARMDVLRTERAKLAVTRSVEHALFLLDARERAYEDQARKEAKMDVEDIDL